MEFCDTLNRRASKDVNCLTYPLQLLEDTGVEILVHISVLEGIVRGLLGGIDGSIEVL